MRVAIVTESFLPQANGLTESVRYLAGRLLDTGHDVLVVAPAPGLSDYRGIPVVRVRAVAVPGLRSVPVGLPDHAAERALARFAPDVVHLAAPVCLGAAGLQAARRLGVPTVAAYEPVLAGIADQWVGRVHRRATRTLVPTRASYRRLTDLGVTDVHLWARGVDLDLFGPRFRNLALHDKWARRGRPDGDAVVVGYVGALTAEKQVRRLRELAGLPGTRLVVVGDGPELAWLRRKLPDAKFPGRLTGPELAQAVASLDILVQTDETESSCRALLEAQASGVAVVAPSAGGALSVVAHGVTGLLHDPADRGSLRQEVAILAADPWLRATVAERGRQRVAGRDWSAVVDELVATHYAAVTGGFRAPAVA